jgi:DNA-binding transcriptional MerR regulator
MNYQIKQSKKEEAKIKLAIKGVSGAGKSLSALLLAKGLCGGDLSKAVVIDTENSIELYSHVGDFRILSLSQPFSPENYIRAIEACENAGFGLIIIDSISHCWHYLLQVHGNMPGNSFTNWNRITPMQNAFVQKIQQSNCHIICTMRSKQDYLIQTLNGKTTIEKVGLKAIQREEIEYEFTTVLDIDINHKAKAVKDRTGLFTAKDSESFTISEDTGCQILKWCKSGIAIDDIKQEIQKAANMTELISLYNQYPHLYNILAEDFEQQKTKINTNQKQNNNLNSNNNERNTNHANHAKYTN